MALMDQFAAPSPASGLPFNDQDYDAAVASGDLNRLFALLEKEQGLPAGYLARTAKIESSGNPNAKNPNSSAEGLFQFINSTGRAYGLNSSADKRDPVMASLAAAQLAGENQDYLRERLGREPTAGELYLAHQQGAGGAAKLLANPNAPASAVVGADAARLNGGAGQTAGQLASRWTSKFGDPAGATLPGGSTMAGVEGSDKLAGGSGGDQFKAGMMSQPARDDGNPLLQAVGMALLSGTRQNPLANLPQILQSQARLSEQRNERDYNRQRDQRDFDLRKSEIERSQANTLFQQKLATAADKRAADAAAKGEVRTLPDGSTVRINDDNTTTQLTPPIRQLNEVEARKQNADALGLTGEARTNYILTGKYEGGANVNPYSSSPGIKTTGEQDKSAGFADRMFQNEGTIRQFESVGTDRVQRGLNAIPGVGSMLRSEDFTKFDAAKQNWIAAQLRKESGAAIGSEEYAAADRQYFPQPGDSPEVIAQKRSLRETATKGMARDGGPGYQPPMVFDEGKLVPNPRLRGAQSSASPTQAKPPVEQRYQALVGGGMTKEQAYAKLREEGY